MGGAGDRHAKPRVQTNGQNGKIKSVVPARGLIFLLCCAGPPLPAACTDCDSFAQAACSMEMKKWIANYS